MYKRETIIAKGFIPTYFFCLAGGTATYLIFSAMDDRRYASITLDHFSLIMCNIP